MAIGLGINWAMSGDDGDGTPDPDAAKKEETPDPHPEKFKPVRGTNGKEHKETGEVFRKDRLHKDHYEVYKNRKSAVEVFGMMEDTSL